MTRADYTHIALIVDRSGSMRPIAADMDGAIVALLETQEIIPGELTIDVSVFDDVLDHLHSSALVKDVKGPFVNPRGMTALNDAIGLTVKRLGERLEALPEDERPEHVIVGIVTDGGENASKEYRLEDVKAMVDTQRDQFGWVFMFYGVKSMDVFGAAAGYGIDRGHTMSYDHSPVGTQHFAAASASAFTRSRAGGDASFTDEERDESAIV